MLKNFWLKFGCVLTGYDFKILTDCSQISKNYVKKITSALILVSIVWFFIGFLFCSTYLQLTLTGAIFGACVSVICIIQIEKQIILGGKITGYGRFLRIALAVIVAIIGSAIIDQVLFKSDINIKRIDNLSKSIKKRTIEEDQNFRSTVDRIQSQISLANLQIGKLDDQISRHPTITSSVSHNKVYIGGKLQASGGTVTKILSPSYAERDGIKNDITGLNSKLTKNQEEYSKKIDEIKASKLGEKPGFLDELRLMIELLKESNFTLFIYALWFSFFLIIELFILISTGSKPDNDYDRILQYQMDIRESRLKVLEARTNNYLGEDATVSKSKALVDQYPN